MDKVDFKLRHIEWYEWLSVILSEFLLMGWLFIGIMWTLVYESILPQNTLGFTIDHHFASWLFVIIFFVLLPIFVLFQFNFDMFHHYSKRATPSTEQ